MTRVRDQLLSTSDVAGLLNISADAVRYLERRGKLLAQYTASSQRIFRLDDVEKLARARGVRGELVPPDAA